MKTAKIWWTSANWEHALVDKGSGANQRGSIETKFAICEITG